MLSFTGAIIGVALANSLEKLIVNWLPEFSFPHEAAISINMPALFFSVSLALLTRIAFGISPALQSARPDIAQVMQAHTRQLNAGGTLGRPFDKCHSAKQRMGTALRDFRKASGRTPASAYHLHQSGLFLRAPHSVAARTNLG